MMLHIWLGRVPRLHGFGTEMPVMQPNRSSEKKRLATVTNEKLLNELSIKKTYLVAFPGHIDATGTT